MGKLCDLLRLEDQTAVGRVREVLNAIHIPAVLIDNLREELQLMQTLANPCASDVSLDSLKSVCETFTKDASKKMHKALSVSHSASFCCRPVHRPSCRWRRTWTC